MIQGLTKAGLAPVLSNIRQIVADNRPNVVDSIAGVSIILLQSVNILDYRRCETYDQPVTELNKGDGTQSRTIALRTAPAASECAQVHVELGLAETSTI